MLIWWWQFFFLNLLFFMLKRSSVSHYYLNIWIYIRNFDYSDYFWKVLIKLETLILLKKQHISIKLGRQFVFSISINALYYMSFISVQDVKFDSKDLCKIFWDISSTVYSERGLYSLVWIIKALLLLIVGFYLQICGWSKVFANLVSSSNLKE